MEDAQQELAGRADEGDGAAFSRQHRYALVFSSSLLPGIHLHSLAGVTLTKLADLLDVLVRVSRRNKRDHAARNKSHWRTASGFKRTVCTCWIPTQLESVLAVSACSHAVAFMSQSVPFISDLITVTKFPPTTCSISLMVSRPTFCVLTIIMR